MPNKNLLVSWTGVGAAGSGSATLVGNGACLWQTACGGAGGQVIWTMRIFVPTSIEIDYLQYVSDCPTGTLAASWNSNLTPSSVYPFSLTYLVSPGDPAYAVGYRTVVFSDPSPGGRCCFLYINVTGCNGAALAGATVTVWTDNTKTTLLATGITDSSGNVDLNLGTAGGVFYYEASAGRFATASATDFASCGQYNAFDGLYPITMSPAAGYQCISGCAVPLAATLTATWSMAGAQTLSWTGTAWAGTFLVGGNTYVMTLNTDNTYSLTRNGVACAGASAYITQCPPSFLMLWSLPVGACAADLGTTATVTE
jgi:hypothetical protein